MRIGSSKYSIKATNYKQRTPEFLKLLADLMLMLSAMVEIGLPDFPAKTWIVFGGMALKIISKFITEHIPVAQQGTPPGGMK